CAVWTGSSWSSYYSGENGVPASGTVVLKISRSGTAWTLTSSGAKSGSWTFTGTSEPVAGIYLMHTRYFNYPYDNAKWNYVRTNIPGDPQPVNGTLAGLVDYMYWKSGTFCANTTVTYNQELNTFVQVENPPQTFTLFDSCSSTNNWSGSNGRIDDYASYTFASDGNVLYVYGGSSNTGYRGYTPFMERSCAIYAASITVEFDTRFYKSFGNLYGASFTGVHLKLANGTYVSNTTSCDLSDQSWKHLTYTFTFSQPQAITGVRFTWSASGYYCFSAYFYLDNVSAAWIGDPGLTIKGVPANDVVKIYQGSILKKTVVSSGTDIVISPADVPQPFSGSILVVDRPYLRPAGAYSGTLDWNDVLVYSGGTLTKKPSGVNPERVNGGSECTTTEGWNFTYSLVSGGQTPTFSASSGYVRFDEPRLSYYYPPGSDIPTMEAWYYFRYDVNSTVRNLTVSVAADGSFTYYAAGDQL
ncbi:MAG: hypothetical protein ACPL2E_08170, partial [Conexivisphaera sp.]